MKSKKIISLITAIIMTLYVCAMLNASADSSSETVYNFSKLTNTSYNKGGEAVFDGALTVSGTEAPKPLAVNKTIASPAGNSVLVTSALTTKQLAVKITLAAGETVVGYYCGSDSGGTSAKALDMVIKDAAGNIVATESNAENSGSGVMPYVIYYTAKTAGEYTIVENGTSTYRTVLYAVGTTTGTYNPSVTPVPETEITPDPNVTPTPSPTPRATIDPNEKSEIAIQKAVGWLETAYVTWTNPVAVEKYNVYVKPEGGNYTKLDDELVRCYGSYYRADALGLKAGKYQLKVAAVIGGAETDVKETGVIDVKAHKREGYAFDSHSPNYNPDGIGGYKHDGTVKDNAKIIYIDNNNKDTVRLNVVTDTSKGTTTEGMGLVNILALREKTNAETTPLIIRMIGQVEAPVGVNSSQYVQIKATSNVTFEGVGDDATTYHWSLLIRDTNNVEIRNIAVMEFYDDGISLDTSNFNDWVHNCDIFYGQNRGGDQKKGDGSLDIKMGSDYATFSYNHFWDCGKTSLCGMTQDVGNTFRVTYAHNWFDHSDSRHPRVRAGTIHLYNNYYDGNAKYGVGATTASNIFVEKNVFRNCTHPVLISMQGTDIASGTGTFSGEDGGMIKMYNNSITGGSAVVNAKDNATEFDAYIADTRDEQVPSTYVAKAGGKPYSNFDTADTMYDYTPLVVEDVVEDVSTYAGRMEGGDFNYEFDDSVDDKDAARNEILGAALENYKTSLVISYASDDYYPATGNGQPSEPGATNAPQATNTPVTEKCVKITATYDNEHRLTGVTIEENVSIDEAVPSDNGNTKVMYWTSLSSMKPVIAVSVK